MASEKDSPAKKVMGGKSKKKKKAKLLRDMHIRRADSGGFIAKHGSPMPGQEQQMGEQEEHVMPGMAELLSHVQDHLGEPLEPQEQAG